MPTTVMVPWLIWCAIDVCEGISLATAAQCLDGSGSRELKILQEESEYVAYLGLQFSQDGKADFY